MYSVRMRASLDNKHISGAERVVEEKDIKNTAHSLIERALTHEKGKPDFINISAEEIKTPIKSLTSLPITLLHVENADKGKTTAEKLLAHIGIPTFCIERAFSFLEDGACNGEGMRGAIIMDMQGRRLESDKKREVRASRMDITAEASGELAAALVAEGLSSNYLHIKEALVLATKVASVKGTVAELCWSDDPGYVAGYVASKKFGYMRISCLKNEGDRGGRVFFVNDIGEDYINEIEKTPVIVNKFAGIIDITGGQK